MCSASCNASVQPDCLRKSSCGHAQEKTGSVIIWIVALDEHMIQLFVHQPGRPIEPMSVGCCCSVHAGNLDNLAKYLDAALACGQYSGLVLMGAAETQKRLKTLLSDTVQRRIIAEIDRDVTGLQPPELLQAVQECALF